MWTLNIIYRACPYTLLYKRDLIIIIYVTKSVKNDYMQ